MLMVRLDDIRSLTDFQRNAREHIRRLKRTGQPEVLTVNGQAELVVQDARAYQTLLDRAEEAERRERLSRGIADYRAGRARDLDDALDDLEDKHFTKTGAAGKRRSR
jgi:PHD/YefM family antitoxin component YafN of YafNO toxin-antitoxin module